MLYSTIPSNQPFDYFTIRPSADDHFSTETPVSPDCVLGESTSTAIPTPTHTHPLLARRDSSSPAYWPAKYTIDVPSILQMQTDASQGQTVRRPNPTPIQNVLHTTSDDSDKSSSSSSNTTRHSSIELARCSRCHRTPSIDARTGKNNMVEYGLNLWYCTRCAQMVGLGNR